MSDITDTIQANTDSAETVDATIAAVTLAEVTPGDIYRSAKGRYFIVKDTIKAVDESAVVVLLAIDNNELYVESLANVDGTYELAFSVRTLLNIVES